MPNLGKIAKEIGNNECIIIFSSLSRFYLSHFKSSDGVLLIKNDRSVLYLDSRYYEAGLIAKKNGIIPDQIEIKPYVFIKDFSEMKEIKIAYFEDRVQTVCEFETLKKRFPSISFLPLGTRLEELRKEKTRDEIRKIGESQKLAEAAFSDILTFLSPDVTEIEVAARLEYFMKKNGASCPSFETICVSGERSSLPHGVPSKNKLRNDSFVTLDFGCVLDGYCSDMTRTVVIGHASEKMKLVYNTVLSAQENAMKKIRAGVLGSEVDLAARQTISDAGFGEYFGHSLGHGVGIEVHEAPNFSPNYRREILENSVLSVEPGIYLPGEFGVRIENLVAVTKDGYEDLNSSKRELIEL